MCSVEYTALGTDRDIAAEKGVEGSGTVDAAGFPSNGLPRPLLEL
jgi:hypothetical protein